MIGQRQHESMNRAMPEHILAVCNVSMPELSSMEGASSLPMALVLLHNHPSSKDTRLGPLSTSRYSCPPVAVLNDFATSPSFGDAGL